MEDLVHNALWNWVSTCHQDYEDYYSFERFQETAEELDWKFTEDGNDRYRERRSGEILTVTTWCFRRDSDGNDMVF